MSTILHKGVPCYRCLSLWQPWPVVMLDGPKDLENRGWPTKHRGLLLVHAGLTKCDMCHVTHERIWKLWPEWREKYASPDTRYSFGAIVGVVDVTHCDRAEQFAGNPWAWGPWCHVWANRRSFPKPIPYTGKQGMMMVRASIVAEQLAAVGVAA